MTQYYDELEGIIRARCQQEEVALASYSAPAVIEELGPYLASFGEVYGSYLERPMPWVTAREVTRAICGIDNLEASERKTIFATSRQTVEEALNGLAGRCDRKCRRYRYRHIAPNILAEVYHQKGFDGDDSQIADQLPYYQYYVSQLG
ncbi:hypothetical protein [Actinomyces trachealis]|uniref:hypothetical protein n=1 Tax=Actinomyces trachealis TaxID=2763540 RepID=UPI0018928D0A|nr:hypothetical protein [Actinomyces trachealis]